MTIDFKSPGFALAILLIAAILLGGGGAGFGLLNLAVQATALLLIAFHFETIRDFWRGLDYFGRILMLVTVLLPVLQAIPLPPAIWTQLPGRDLVLESYTAISSEDKWFSFSIDPRRTLLAASGLIAPIIALILASRLENDRSTRALEIVVGLAAASLAIGAIQLLSGNEVLSWYPNRDNDELYGFFANHNATGLFFVVALCCLASLPIEKFGRQFGSIVYWGLALALILGTILTQSRSSTALLIVPCLFFIWVQIRSTKARSRSFLIRGFAMVGIATAGAALLIFSNSKLAQTWTRFDDLEDMRPGIWQDTLAAIDHFWPLGSGMGTYRDAFEIFESLENINPLTAGRAHNDYLELALEAGVVGLGLLLVWLVFIARLYFRARNGTGGRPSDLVPTACMVSFGAIALQSAIDYPLRNQALLCVAAALLGTLIAYARRARKASQNL